MLYQKQNNIVTIFENFFLNFQYTVCESLFMTHKLWVIIYKNLLIVITLNFFLILTNPRAKNTILSHLTAILYKHTSSEYET